MTVHIMHVCNLGHRLRVLFDKVHFVSERAIDRGHRSANVILFWVIVHGMCAGWDVGRGRCVRIPWKNLSECVPHFELSIECSVRWGLIRIQAAIFSSSLRRRR